jgi:hypothetical protein
MVALLIAPTLCSAEAELWIASETSLLNLFLAAIRYLHQVPVFDKPGDLLFAQRRL